MGHSYCRIERNSAYSSKGIGGIIFLYESPSGPSLSTSPWSVYSRVFMRDLPVGPNAFVGKRTPFQLELLEAAADAADTATGCRQAASLKTAALADGVIGNVNADHAGNVDAATPPLFRDVTLLPAHAGNRLKNYVGDSLVAVAVPGSRQRLGCCRVRECDHPCCQGPVVGRCRALMPRWYYNFASGKCFKFFFGGCEAQKNNFKTEDECMRKCKGYKPK